MAIDGCKQTTGAQMSPEDLGRIIHRVHAEGAAKKIEQGAYVPPPWEALYQHERECYIAQAEAVRAALEVANAPKAGVFSFASWDGEFDFDDTPHTPCPMAPYATCINDDEPEPSPPLIALMRGVFSVGNDEQSTFACVSEEPWVMPLSAIIGLPLHMLRNPDSYVACEPMAHGPCLGGVMS